MKTGGFFMGEIMKKVFFLLFTVLPVVATARTMCVRDNSLVISLDSSISGTSSAYDQEEWVFWTDFSYGRIYGEGTCLSANESLGQTVQGSYYGAGDYVNTIITAEPGMYGTDADGNARTSCWCRITHPVQSLWVYRNTESGCKQYCTQYCGDFLKSNMGHSTKVRAAVFKSIGIK